MQKIGEEPFRANQLFNWIYKKNTADFDKMLNISRESRKKFSEIFFISSFRSSEEFRSSDGTIKFRFGLDDGYFIESVYIPEEKRNTLCISTQVGCPLGCKFCLTGEMGFKRNLSVSEMVNEVMSVKERTGRDRITNIVLMGMGEPLLNYENVKKFINILIASEGLAFAKRKVTLSTSGILPELEKFIKEVDVSLSISLNAPDDETRSRIMPINRKFPLKEILRAASLYPEVHKRMVTFEYVLIKGINDSLKQAEKLASLLKGLRCKINLIPYNENPYSEFKRPADETVLAFQEILKKHNYTATIRKSRGQDISAACGQLGGHISTSQNQDRSL
jgi:23S rRNA (adenine2503-C2)-methyltransferase